MHYGRSHTPYATFHLHPDAVRENDCESPSPPPILTDSDSSLSDVEWETIHPPLEHVVDGMIEAGMDIISAVNEFSGLIASTMKDAPSTATDEEGLGAPRSTRKRQLPLTSCTVRTRSAAKAARKRLHASFQPTTNKRKMPHAAGAPPKRQTTDQETNLAAAFRPIPKKKSARAAGAARLTPKRKPPKAAGAAQQRTATNATATRAGYRGAAHTGRARRELTMLKAPTTSLFKRTTRSRVKNINERLESLCPPVSVEITASDSRACARSSPLPSPPSGEEGRNRTPHPKKRERTRQETENRAREVDDRAPATRRKTQRRSNLRACARLSPPLPSPAGEEDRSQEPSARTRKRTRQELDELASVARRMKQQRLDFGQHFKRPP